MQIRVLLKPIGMNLNEKDFFLPFGTNFKLNVFVCVNPNSDAGIREAECEKSAMDVKYATDTKIEDNSRMYKLQKAHFDQEINTAVSGSHFNLTKTISFIN